MLCTGLSLSTGMTVRSQGCHTGGRCVCVCTCFRRQQNRTQLAVTPHSSSRRTASRMSLARGARPTPSLTLSHWAAAPWAQPPKMGQQTGKKKPRECLSTPETSLARARLEKPACPGLLLLGLPWLSLQGWPGVALGSLPGHTVPSRLHNPVPSGDCDQALLRGCPGPQSLATS